MRLIKLSKDYLLSKKYNYLFCIISLCSGLFITLAQPPFYLFFLLPISVWGILWLLENSRSIRQILFCGWLCGFAYFSSGLYWIGNSLFAEGSGQFIWLWPFSFLGIPAVLACYIALLFLLTKHFENNYTRAIALSVNWVFIELLRSYFPLPFPWHLLGYAVVWEDNLLQLAAYIGVYGISLLLMLISSLFYYKASRIFAVFLLLGSWAFGHKQLSYSAAIEEQSQGYIRIIQPSFSMDYFSSEEARKNAVTKLLESSSQPSKKKLDLIIWPEGVFPYTLHKNSGWFYVLGNYFQGTPLLMGSDYLSMDSKEDVFYNSMFFITPTDWWRYDKQILVPFGEYVPAKSYIPFIKKIARGLGEGFTHGLKPSSPFTIFANKKVITAICYEIIFTSHFYPLAAQADFIINITNDAWFGDSIGPAQHLAMAQLRAVETALPVVRAANNGISAIISPQGKVLQRLSLNKDDALDYEIYKKSSGETFYHEFFIKIFAIITCTFVIMHIVRLRIFLSLRCRK
jgi:apolipoprotein N-acyltransferase